MRKVVQIFKQIFKWGPSTTIESAIVHGPVIIPRESHKISRGRISKAALKVLYRLHRAGFSAYLVGGSVRDLLLGLSPKDFDIATDAHPEQIQRLFNNSFIIGKRFKLVHVRFGAEIIEVATFRGASSNAGGRIHTKHGLLLRDNVYGTLEDDVWRRDFTVNALYYNISDFSVVDFTGGMNDLKARTIRVIGDCSARYREDPARMLRAIRLAGKLNFTIEEETAKTIRKHKGLLKHIPPARLFDKLLKIFHSGKSFEIFKLLREYGLFSLLFPKSAQVLQSSNCEIFLEEALKNTDQRVKEEKTINSSFLFAIILWYPLKLQKDRIVKDKGLSQFQALQCAISEIMQSQLKLISIPRKFTVVMNEIWLLQYHLENARPRRINQVLHHPRFRAAYDFLVLRGHLDKNLEPLCEWWQAYQEAEEAARAELIVSRFNPPKGRKRKRKRKRKTDVESISSPGE
jgi:poly(A) polymerase